MSDEKAQIEARYHVISLLYRGNLAAAKLALETYSQHKLLSARDESSYRRLLDRAQEEKSSEGTATLSG